MQMRSSCVCVWLSFHLHLSNNNQWEIKTREGENVAISVATSLKVDPLITFGRLDTHVGPNENKHIQFIGTKILFLVSNFHIMNMVIYQLYTQT